MQRIACSTLAFLAAAALMGPLKAQIITAQPARNFNLSGQYTATYPPGYADATLDGLLQSPEANSIRGWYRDYLGRDVGQDLTGMVKLLRGGMSTTDLQATILGSDEFFTQKGRDPQTFVRDTLQAVTWSEPSYADVQRWTERLNQLRGDRFALAREILLAGNSTQPQAPTIQLADVAGRLASAAQLAVQTIDFEIGNTPQGRQANLQAQALVDATNQLRAVASAPGYNRAALYTAQWALGMAQSALCMAEVARTIRHWRSTTSIERIRRCRRR